MDEQKEKITEKFILSMTAKEHLKARKEVRNLLLKLYYKTTCAIIIKLRQILLESGSEPIRVT